MKYRYQVSEAFKQECKANFATSRQGKIHIVEDNIDITGENYEGELVDFTIDDNCYVNDKFIGTTVSKKITVNILNPNNEINLENKTIKPYVGINNEYVPFSTFVIEKPENKEYEEKTSFTGYDYMIKFKIPYINTNTYPTTIGNILKNLCNFVGVECGTTTFVNSDYIVMGNPFTNNEECTLVLSNIAQLAGGFAHIGRDDKLYIVNIGELIKGLSVENVHEIQVSNLNETLIRYLKNDSGTSISDEIDGNTYYTLQKNLIYGEVNKVTLKLDSNVDGEETSLSDEKSIKDNGLTEITITGNYFLTNEEDRKKAIEQLWETLRYLKYLPFKIEEYYGFPYLDVGDAISIVDSKDIPYRSYIFNHSFKYNGSFSGSIETTAMTKVQEQYKITTVKEKFRKVELSVDKINGTIKAIINKQSKDEEKLTQLELNIDGITATVANNKKETDEALQETKTELETRINVSAEGVESKVNKTLESYSTTEETNRNISNAKTEAINSANTNTDNKLKNYSTTTQMNSAITQKANEITSSVSETYITKTDSATNVSNAKAEAIKTAGTNTDNKLKDYSTTTEMNSAITQKANEINLEVNKKVDNTDFTGGNILLKINDDISEAQIKADKIDINGKKVKFKTDIESTYTYTAEDLSNIQKYIMGEYTLTDEQKELYDINKDGKVTSTDYVLIKKLRNTSTGKTIIKGTFEIDPDSASRSIILKNESGDIITSIGLLGMETENFSSQYINSDNIIATNSKIKNLIVDETISGNIEKIIWQGTKSINSVNGSSKNLTGMSDLTEYSGKTVNFYVKYNGDQSKKFSFIIGDLPYWIEYVRNFNGTDIWHTLFNIGNTNSTTWKIETGHSYVVTGNSINQIDITNSNYMFYLEKVTIN